MSIPPQFVEDVKVAVKDRVPVDTYLRSGGNMLSVAEIVEKAMEMVRK
jgi:2-oxoglutarate ferredoxin oxidoreductase subunit alpha